MSRLIIYLFILSICQSCSSNYSNSSNTNDSSGHQVISIDGIDCGMHGSAHPGRPEYGLNESKNRYNLPTKGDFTIGIALNDLISSGNENQFPIDKAVILTGYVFDVKMGGVETCNCKTKDETYRDTHIELTPDDQHTGPEYRVIVEVTPRIRAIMAVKGIDWSTETLKSTLMGHRVKIAGWLFYDSEHKGQAFATNPDNEKDWRASCWEIHPITSIKVLY
jgi:hypothetical protein